MKFNRVNLLLRILYGGNGILSSPDGAKTFRERSNMVPVTIPHAQGGRNTGKQLGPTVLFRITDAQLRSAIFPPLCLLYRAAECVGDPLHPVAKDRKSVV